MGAGRFNPADYAKFASSTAEMTTEDIYTARAMDPSLNPLGVKIRESRDSADNPNSTPVIVGIDVTGSMGMIAHVIAQTGLGVLFNNIIDRKPISDPHVMFMAIGDANHDRAPLQVSQFEADNRIVQQLTQIYLEGGGGGNNFESYNLPWYFAALHTVHDSMEKRGKRGYLFTIGDECAPNPLTRAQIKTITGDDVEVDMTTSELLALAQRTYDVFHVVIEEGSYARSNIDRVMASWTPLLGQHVIRCSDHTKIAEVIVSAIEVAEGADADAVAKGWGAGVDSVILAAIKDLPPSNGPKLLPPSA